MYVLALSDYKHNMLLPRVTNPPPNLADKLLLTKKPRK